MNPPETVTFGVEIDTDPSMLEVGHSQGISVSIRWDANEAETSDEFEVR